MMPMRPEMRPERQAATAPSLFLAALALAFAPVAAGAQAPVPRAVQEARVEHAAEHAAERQPEPGRVALTFDDLPALTLLNSQPWVDALNAKLLHGLKRHHVPATGFVNEGKFDDLVRPRQIAVLRTWLDAGMDLGNHSFSHESPNDLGEAGYEADIVKGEPVTRALLARHGRKLRWFRHPYLETGSPMAVHRGIDEWLTAHGYRIAPVTLDADDWEFAEPYEIALAHRDKARARAIRAEYLAYTSRMIGWYRAGSHALFGRDIAYVMLLHATRLNADCLDDLAGILARERLTPVTLDEAMEDPAYRTPDIYDGRDGIAWLERWALYLKRDLAWTSYADPPRDIERDYNRVDPGGR